MTAHVKQVAIELREIRKTLEVLEAAYFNIVDRLDADDTPYLLSMPKAAKLLGIGKKSLHWLIDDKKVRATKVGKKVMVARIELERFAGRIVGFHVEQGLANRKLTRRALSWNDLTSQEARAESRRKAALLDQARNDIARANAATPGQYGPSWARNR